MHIIIVYYIHYVVILHSLFVSCQNRNINNPAFFPLMAHNILSTQLCPHKAGLTGPETRCQKERELMLGNMIMC